jgi:hypothetical protein
MTPGKPLFLLSFCTLAVALSGQTDPLAIGQWRAVLPYTTGLVVTQSPDHVYYATTQSLLQIDKQDSSPRFFSRVEGLSENRISRMAYSRRFNTLVLGYASGNLDLMGSAGVSNIPDIATNLTITGDKSIYDIYLFEDSLAVISCGFGLVQFNLSSRLFQRTAYTGGRVLQTTYHDGYWYTATEDGLFRLPITGFFQNFPAWERLGPAHGLPLSYAATGVANRNGTLFLALNDALWQWDGQSAVQIYQLAGHQLNFLQESDGFLFTGLLPGGGAAGRLLVLDPLGEQRLLGGDCVGRPTGALIDQQSRIWLADQWLDFRSLLSDGSDCQRLTYNSPFGFSASEIRIWDDGVHVAAGTIAGNLSGASNNAGIYILREGEWKNYNFFRYPELLSWQAHIDYNTIDVDPRDGTIYAGSYYGGLLRIRGEELTIFQDHNSALQGATGDPLRERVGGLVRDLNGNLWIANALAPEPLVLFSAQGEWRSFKPLTSAYLLKGAVDQRNNKWFVLGTGGILVYHEGQDLLDAGDDRFRVLDNNNANLPSAKVTSVGVDLDGAIWIGTDDGVGVVRCPDVFESVCRASRVVVTQDGVTEALLNDEEIRAIAVDGANRKWLGTRNGLFVQSPDGLTEVARFTEENSPLLDKQINALAFNPRNGEMWIGTERGLMVFQTDAPAGGEIHASEVEVYPNPVRPDYHGPIAIKGLPRNANVKITDLHGRLVFETTALGGQAIWNGQDYTGRRAATGVYLVFSTANDSFNTPDKAVSRIVLVR